MGSPQPTPGAAGGILEYATYAERGTRDAGWGSGGQRTRKAESFGEKTRVFEKNREKTGKIEKNRAGFSRKCL
jgi:hypothetical protein